MTFSSEVGYGFAFYSVIGHGFQSRDPRKRINVFTSVRYQTNKREREVAKRFFGTIKCETPFLEANPGLELGLKTGLENDVFGSEICVRV